MLGVHNVCVCVCLSIEVIGLYVGRDLGLPLVSVVEELLLVVEQLFVALGGKLKVGTLRVERGRERSNVTQSFVMETHHL